MNAVAKSRRRIPSLDRLLREPPMAALVGQYGRQHVTDTARAELDRVRAALARGGEAFDTDAFVESCSLRLAREAASSLRAVFNLTGTVLHTNLGRAILPASAIQAVTAAMSRPVNLELDLEDAERGERDSHVEPLITALTGGEAALVVNNNAAAVYLALNTLAARREVPVSRGELVEIGGSFRIPDIMARAGCRLIEVGTTNRTHLRDYERAISPRTAAIMKVHASNYSVQGFTAAVEEPRLAALAHRHELPLIDDLGSGTLLDLEELGLPHERTPREALAAGADVVTFSADKLLGGPQAGIAVGRRELIERMRANPMKRALRVDKMTLAALDAVLRLCRDPGRARREIPTLAFLTRPAHEIAAQAERIAPLLQRALQGKVEVGVAEVRSQIGSGSLPVDSISSHAISLSVPGKRRHALAGAIARAFRELPVPVLGRIHDGAFLLDLRCLDREEEFAAQLARLEAAKIA
jgi:L-seryl-tRNA(Ser) seleniumtransferase